jgi:hypothetical protein
MTLNGNVISKEPGAFFRCKYIDIYKIQKIDRLSLSKTIIYFYDESNNTKRVKIGRLDMSVINQIELNDYIKKLRDDLYTPSD